MPLSYSQLASKVLNTFSPAVVGKWKVGQYKDCDPIQITLHCSMIAVSHGGRLAADQGDPEQKLELMKQKLCQVDDSGADR